MAPQRVFKGSPWVCEQSPQASIAAGRRAGVIDLKPVPTNNSRHGRVITLIHAASRPEEAGSHRQRPYHHPENRESARRWIPRFALLFVAAHFRNLLSPICDESSQNTASQALRSPSYHNWSIRPRKFCRRWRISRKSTPQWNYYGGSHARSTVSQPIPSKSCRFRHSFARTHRRLSRLTCIHRDAEPRRENTNCDNRPPVDDFLHGS